MGSENDKLLLINSLNLELKQKPFVRKSEFDGIFPKEIIIEIYIELKLNLRNFISFFFN